MSRKFIMADIHGEYEKLLSCLQQVDFDYENDTLIQLGDIVDRGSQSYECVEELLKIKNLIAIRGNHDAWWQIYLNTGTHPINFHHGGKETYESYIKNVLDERFPDVMPQHHVDFFNRQVDYYIDDKNRCFVHGGFDRHRKIDNQTDPVIYYWDRDLWTNACFYEQWSNQKKYSNKNGFSEIFIGHTNSLYYGGHTSPKKSCNIWNLDTGSGFSDGKLTIMNVETKEFKQA